jgi:glyoxylase-like metal-dependent hydrolase (beta-lactamase superfamily II)
VALSYPFSEPPAYGESREILPGIHWVRLPLPLKLDHVNVWVLEDGDGMMVVDTGVGDRRTRSLWPTIRAGLPAKPLRRLLVTHHHPDHCGLADELVEESGAELAMSATAHEAGLVLRHLEKGTDMRSTAARLAMHGLSAEAQASLVQNEANLGALKPGLPGAFTPLTEGATATTGRYSWRVMFGQGHAPDHVCLYCDADGKSLAGGADYQGILISGDMLLPHISTHVGSPATWLPGNPVALFQQSLSRLARLPADTLVLPSHGEPFVGLRERVAELNAHHEERCRTIADVLGGARSAAELLQVVFRRELDPLQLMLAMNEAIAHLEYMTERGELERSVGDGGVTRYVRRSP